MKFSRDMPVSTGQVSVLAACSLVLLVLLESTLTISRESPMTEVQKHAFQKVTEAQRLLFRERAKEIPEQMPRELTAIDVNESGVVGIEWSHLVTTPGSLQAKQLSADPRWALLFCEWYKRAGVERGSRVAIGSSASFPALLLSARIAAEAMGAEPVIAGSLTSSNFGATNPDFDLYQMEEVLRRRGLIEHPMALLTPGGEQDALYGFAAEDRKMIENRLQAVAGAQSRTRVAFPKDLAESIALREEYLFPPGKAPRVFINIGGHSANYGVGRTALALPSGYIDPSALSPEAITGDSVAMSALRRSIPVINMINIRGIAMENSQYFSGNIEAGPEISREEWTTAQRAIAALAAFAFIAFCFVIREPDNKEKYPIQGESSHA